MTAVINCHYASSWGDWKGMVDNERVWNLYGIRINFDKTKMFPLNIDSDNLKNMAAYLAVRQELFHSNI